jgi:hypothetical protein
LRALLFDPPFPPNEPHQTNLASAARKPATHGGKMAKLIILAILAIFVKQTTYLAILPLFGHLALVTLLLFGHLAQSLPTPEEFQKDET